MTDKEIMQQALDALETVDSLAHYGHGIDEARETLRQAISDASTDTSQIHTCTWPSCKSEAYKDKLATEVHAELIGQKPVAWRYKFVGEERWQHTGNRENLHALCLIEPLYTSPPARAWGV
jgi:hypothetical protein